MASLSRTTFQTVLPRRLACVKAAVFALLCGCEASPEVSVDVSREVVPDVSSGSPDGGLIVTDAAVDLGMDVHPADIATPDSAVDATPDAPPDAAPPTVIHVELGRHPPGGRIDFMLPEGYSGVLLQARGQPARLYSIANLSGPDGRLIGATPSSGPLRASANPGAAVALVPNTDDPDFALRPGAYSFEIAADGESSDLPVEAWFVAPSVPRAIQINVLIPPETALDPDGAEVAAFLMHLESQFETAFGVVTQARPQHIGEEAPADLIIDSASGDLSGLADLAAAAGELQSFGLDLYLVGQIEDGGVRQSGFSGGLPAPIGLRGSPASAIVIRTSLLADFPSSVAGIAVHELGHALGLYHTTGPFAERTDPIQDTLECPLECDADGDGVVFARECGAMDTGEAPCRGASDNLMFWTLGGRTDVTPGQREVVWRHPALHLAP